LVLGVARLSAPNPWRFWTAVSEHVLELGANVGGEAEGQRVAALDDGPPDAGAVFGEPLEQRVAGEAFSFFAALGSDQRSCVAGFLGEAAQLGEGQRLLDQVPLGEFDFFFLCARNSRAFLQPSQAGLP
jgi:hypothetical protein